MVLEMHEGCLADGMSALGHTAARQASRVTHYGKFKAANRSVQQRFFLLHNICLANYYREVGHYWLSEILVNRCSEKCVHNM